MPDIGVGLDELSGTAATSGTELEQIVEPYSEQIDEAASGFSESTMSTWQGTQLQTANVPTSGASPENGDVLNTSSDAGPSDPWLAAFFGDDQNTPSSPTANTADPTEQLPAGGDDPASENEGGDDNLPEPTVSGGFTTTTTVNGDTTTTTYTLTSSISLESGSMVGGDQSDDSRWDIPLDWTDKAGTIPDDSDDGDADVAPDDVASDDVTSESEAEGAATNQSGLRFKASTTITVSVTTGPFTKPDGSTGTTRSVTYTSTGSVVIMVSGAWSSGDEGNTGTLQTTDATADTEASAPSETPPSVAESSMTRAPRELPMGGNGTSASESGEYFWYAYASMTFSITISTTTMHNGAPGGGLSAPSASLNLSVGSGSFSSTNSDVSFQASSTSSTSSSAKSVQVKEENVSGSATSFSLNLGGSEDSGDTDDSGGDAATEDDGPLSFSSTSHNSHKKTTLYATRSSAQSAYSQSSASSNADIEDSSSGSTSISLSISEFSYETKTKNKSEFSSVSESQSTSDPPDSADGTPGSRWESVSSHVIETLDESESTFGFGFGSDGVEFTDEYSSNETVSDVLTSESKGESWIKVYPNLSSGAGMDAYYAPPAPYWIPGPELKMGSSHNIQFNYGGNLEEGFEGSFSKTIGYYQESLKQDGTVDRYEYTQTTQRTFLNTNDGDGSDDGDYTRDDSGAGDAGASEGDGSNPTAGFDTGGGAQSGNGGVPDGGTVVTQPNGDQYVYDADGNLYGMIGANGYVFWPLSWPKPTDDPGHLPALGPFVKPPFMDWDAVDQYGDPCPRIHGDYFPDHVPKEWSPEKIQQLIDEVETSIRNRDRVLDPTTESPEAHRGHEWRIEREEQWLKDLQEALGKAAGPAAATGATLGAGYGIYKILEGAGMFLDRATGVMFFMVSPPGMWDDHSGMGQGPA